MNRRCLIILSVALTLLSANAFAYDFWGITVGSEVYNGADQLTFDGLSGKDIQYVVGGYEYTRVDGIWQGAFAAASPGEAYASHRLFDAQGLFFSPAEESVKLYIFAATPQTGATAPDCGYGAREFGPGDLKIDVGESTYGIGLRLDNLLWAADPATTVEQFKIHKAEGGVDNIHTRDLGTLERVELSPHWNHVNYPSLPAGADAAYAFYVRGTGTLAGTATVNVQDTGISLEGYSVYGYEVTVPWETLGMNPSTFEFSASWRPDCGNDLIAADFSDEYRVFGDAYVPEPAAALALMSGLIGLVGYRRRR